MTAQRYERVQSDTPDPSDVAVPETEHPESNGLLDAFAGGDSDNEESGWVDDRASLGSSDASPSPGAEAASGGGQFRWAGLLNRVTGPRDSASVADGVFGNLVAAKEEAQAPPSGADPETEQIPLPDEDDDISPTEQPPTYEEASADATPSYWETTIMASSWGDEIIVGDMPVGSMLAFAWNMLLSAAFSFIGFIMTYLFHTTHASKGGSLVGFGITLIQTSYDLRPVATTAPGAPPQEFAPMNPNNFEDGPAIGYVLHPTGQSATEPHQPSDAGHNELLANVAFILGVLVIVQGLWDYVSALRLQAAILRRHREESDSAERAQEEGRAAYDAERSRRSQGGSNRMPDEGPSDFEPSAPFSVGTDAEPQNPDPAQEQALPTIHTNASQP